MASGVVFRSASGIVWVSSSRPFKSVSRNERLSAVIFTASTQPRSALNEIMSGGRPPFDSPSPRGLIRSAANRSPTTLVLVGAPQPEARTRSAFEQEPLSRRSFRTRSALVWRRSEGLPTGILSFFKENRLTNMEENYGVVSPGGLTAGKRPLRCPKHDKPLYHLDKIRSCPRLPIIVTKDYEVCYDLDSRRRPHPART